MRFNYTAWPIWKSFDTDNYEKTSFDDNLLKEVIKGYEDRSKGSIDEWAFCLAMMIAAGLEKLYYISENFEKAVKMSYTKLIAKPNVYLEKPIKTGIFLNKNGGTIFWHDDRLPECKIMLCGFTKEKICAWGTMLGEDNGVGGWADINFLEHFRLAPGGDKHSLMCDWFTQILLTNYFIDNCEIEIKEIGTNEKYKAPNKEKFLNELKNPIKVMDCLWFTTLVSRVAHKVRGFLRWQPYGPGSSLRKLIWIDEFEKKGYTRIAKKELL